MAFTDHDLPELLAALKAGELTDTIRASLEWVLQQLIEAEATVVVGAAPHQRTETRTNQRNGHRFRLWSTRSLGRPPTSGATTGQACVWWSLRRVESNLAER